MFHSVKTARPWVASPADVWLLSACLPRRSSGKVCLRPPQVSGPAATVTLGFSVLDKGSLFLGFSRAPARR